MERGVVERRIKGRGKVFCLTHFLKKQDNIYGGKAVKRVIKFQNLSNNCHVRKRRRAYTYRDLWDFIFPWIDSIEMTLGHWETDFNRC